MARRPRNDEPSPLQSAHPRSRLSLRALRLASPRFHHPMSRTPALSGVTALAVAALLANARAASVPAKLSFNEHVQPILAENCYACHGADPGSRKAELRLDRAEYAFAPRKDGPVIVPHDPDHSPLVKRIESKDEKQQMPPPEAHKTLKPEHIALLRRWVAEGAEYQEHWAFIAPQRSPLPALPAAEANWPRNAIDHFVLARLNREGLTPSSEAD